MELCCWMVLAAGVATTAARLSWMRGARAAAIAALLWGAVPWLAGGVIARSSAAALFARAAEPDRLGTIAALILVEALAGGCAGIRLAAGGGRGGRAWSLAPSPTLALGILGSQTSLYHRASGWSFPALDATISAVVVLGLLGLSAAFRAGEPDRRTRAAGAIPLFTGLAALAVALPPWLSRGPRPSETIRVDARASAATAVIVAAVAGLGLATRLARDSRAHSWKGADGR